MRASDTEREHAVEILNAAAAAGRLTVEELEERIQSVYASVTRRELELLVRDVSVDAGANGHALTTRRPDEGAIVREGPGGSRWVVAIMGGSDRGGRWRIARSCLVLSIMGGVSLDLNDAEFADRVTRLNVFSVMGGGEIRVPHGIEVHVSKIAVMGGNDVRLGDEIPPPGAPIMHIRLVSVMGGYSVRRGRKRTRAGRRRDRELRAAERREEL